MSLGLGTRLGPYEVTALIGVGGMGEVYRARDSKLGRDVALKILPEAFAEDPDRLARFRREAQILAALNHSGIAHIYGLEEAIGRTALVMELVEGPTLADRIAQGPIAVDDALPIARQIAEALEAAHDQGIVHRDLKPLNVKVREDGTVKVLDFGLAKAMEPTAASGDIANSPTITSPAMTQRGVILGTAAYMSPEQARGRPVDKRADIWAFGCVLYEMVTGRRPFTGDDITEILAAIVKVEPDLAAVPEQLRRLVRKCLEKDPKRRLHDIADAWELIGDDAPVAGASSRSDTRTRLQSSVALVLAGAAVASLAWWVLSRSDGVQPSVSYTREPLPAGRFMPVNFANPSESPDLAVAPDGRAIVYRALEAGTYRLYLRFLNDLKATLIGEPGARGVSFSPDSQWIAFTVPDPTGGLALKRVALQGGPAEPLASGLDAGSAATWQDDDTLVVGGNDGRMQTVSVTDGVVTALAADPDGRVVGSPQLLPGGRAVLYTASILASRAAELRVLDLQTKELHRLGPGRKGRYLPTGHLTFVREQSQNESEYYLWAVPFDLNRFEIRGTPRAIAGPVRTGALGAGPNAAVSNAGVLAYLPGTVSAQRRLVWVDRQGNEEPLDIEPREWSNPRISPDGDLILVLTRPGDRDSDVYVWDIPQGLLRPPLTSDPLINFLAAWFPDSRRVLYSEQVAFGPPITVSWRLADGSGGPQVVVEGRADDWAFPQAVTRNGEPVMWGARGLFVLPAGGDGPGRTLAKAPYVNAAVSADSRWLAYDSSRSARAEVLVSTFANPSDVWQITTEGGCCPRWARDGSALYYWRDSDDGSVSIMAVPVGPGLPSTWGGHRVAVSGVYAKPSWDPQYDVAADGRFLVLKSTLPPPPNEIIIVQNWFEELNRLVPTE